MKRHYLEVEEQQLSQIKNISDALLMVVTGYLLAYSSYIFGDHFLYLVYNFLLCVLFHFFIERRWPMQKWIILAGLFILQFPLYSIYAYDNYIYTLAILLIYSGYYITRRFQGLWVLWIFYSCFWVLFTIFPGFSFYMIRGYNLLLTRNFFFLNI